MSGCDDAPILPAARPDDEARLATYMSAMMKAPTQDPFVPDRRRVLAGAAGAAAAAVLAPRPAAAADAVTFGTNWTPQAEHGGFYQALADGTYARHGLDVRIVPGGPQSNNRMLLAAGRLDFYMGGNLIQAFAALEQDIPTVVVAALFQKEPQILLSHPGRGFDRFEDLRRATLFLSRQTVASTFQWLKAEHGFRDEQVKPYAFSAAPFLADPNSAQQGYVTAEPLIIETQGGFRPNVFLLADYGFDSYATTIEARRDLVAGKPDLVQRFVEASILGWSTYLFGDNAAGNAAIRAANPDVTEAMIAYAVARMKADGIVLSGDAETAGIGAMTDARMASFYARMVRAGVLRAGLDIKRAYTLAFVNRGLGLPRR